MALKRFLAEDLRIKAIFKASSCLFAHTNLSGLGAIILIVSELKKGFKEQVKWNV